MGPDIAVSARKKEKSILKQIELSEKAEFIAIYGRRRIGKTYLVHKYFEKHPFYFEFTGTKGLSAQHQINNYTRHLERHFNLTLKKRPSNWTEALEILLDLIEKSSAKKKVIFFDELPWLTSRKSGFLEALDYFWNLYLSKRKDILLIVCGSAANWMISQVINHKGGLHNRVTRPPIAMAPFSLKETSEYLKSRKIDLNQEQIVELYMVTGGVAFYLDQYNQGESVVQFVNKNFFGKNAGLRTEFDRLLESLFDHHEAHEEVIRLLARHSSGLTRQEIIDAIRTQSGGTMTKVLLELEKSDFIQFNPRFETKKKEGTYRLIDEYVLFYLHWVEPLGRTLEDEFYWQKQVGKPRYHTWLGHAFESLCFKHVEQIKRALGISGLTTATYGLRNSQVQIDLVIDRSDKVVNLCEMKYTAKPYQMTEAEGEKIRKRKGQFEKKQVFVTLVTPFPAVRNKHYLSVVDNEINLEELFC